MEDCVRYPEQTLTTLSVVSLLVVRKQHTVHAVRCYSPYLLEVAESHQLTSTAVTPQMVLDKSATDDQLLDALRDEMARLKAQLQQAHQHQAQLQAAAASGTRCECCDTPCLFWPFFCFFLAILCVCYMCPLNRYVAETLTLLIIVVCSDFLLCIL
jgi:hypothetical protein